MERMGWKREVGALEERGNVKELEYGRQLGVSEKFSRVEVVSG